MLAKKKYNMNQLLVMQNFIECEAHRELMIKGLSVLQKIKAIDE